MPQETDCHNSMKMTPQNKISKPIALVALGANQPSLAGSPVLTLTAAIASLRDSPLEIERVSRFYTTPCFPAGAGPDYVNATLSISGLTNPYKLLSLLHKVEADFGRERVQRWGQRCLDLDLLSVGETVLPSKKEILSWINLPLAEQTQQTPDTLLLPHPRLQDRAFVLVPLAEIAPDWIHPVLGKSVLEMRDALPPKEIAAVKPL